MRWIIWVVLSVLAGCQTASIKETGVESVQSELGLPEWQSPRERDHSRVGQIVDLRTGEQVAIEAMLAELASASIVLLGEKHDNPDHHHLQLWLLQAIQARRAQGSVVLEMLTLDQQDRVSSVQQTVRAGAQSDNLAQALQWHKGWDWQLYGELVSYILKQRYPLLASNLNRDALLSIYRNPPELTGVKSTSPTVTQRLSEHIREAHCNKLPDTQLPAMLAVQQQRDRSMAKVLLEAAKPTLLIAGAYHVRYDLGVPLHLEDLYEAEKLQQRVLIFAEADQDVETQSADFVWYTPAVAERDYCAELL